MSGLRAVSRAHRSQAAACADASSSVCYGPSEANAVMDNFEALGNRDKQAILDFLRSL
jgi:hypothetical protein